MPDVSNFLDHGICGQYMYIGPDCGTVIVLAAAALNVREPAVDAENTAMFFAISEKVDR